MSYQKQIVGVIVVFFCFACSLKTKGKKPAEIFRKKNHQNVLLISIDTLRADHLGCYGYQKAKTSTIDQLAKEGIQFTSCYTTAPITLPAHATLMTGQSPLSHGVRDNGTFRLEDESLTLAEIYKEQGYHTAAFIGAFVLDSRFGLDQGFDLYNDKMDSGKKKTELLYEERRAEDVIGGAIEWLEKKKNPFFLFIHCFDPHAPYSPPDEYKGDSQLLEPKDPPNMVANYDAEIAYVDDCLETLFLKLKELGLYDNTIICFVSDHGESLGEHGEPSHAIFIYDSTLHIPWIIRCPNANYANTLIHQQVSNLDIAPTLLHLSGVEWPAASIQGKALLPYSLEVQKNEPVYCESYFSFYNHRWSPIEGVRTEEWKYIKAPKPELYHLGDDPKELHNLYFVEKDQVRYMENLFKEVKEKFSPVDKSERFQVMPLNEDTRKKLEQLGYLRTAPVEQYREETAEYPDPKDMIITLSYFNKAAFHYIRGEYDQALESFRMSLEINPKDLFGNFMTGYIYQKMGEFSKARDQFLYCLQIDPAYLNAYMHLGGVYFKLGQTELAFQQLKKALDLNPGSFEIYQNYGALYTSNGEYDKAIESYERALAIDDEHIDILLGLGNVYLLKKEYQSALQFIQKAVKINPHYIDAYNIMGKIYLAQEKIDDAYNILKYALTMDDQRADVRISLAEVYIHEGEYNLATEQITLAQVIDPNSANSYNCLGTIAIKEGNYHEAIKQLKRAEQLEANSSEIHYNLGISYVHLDDFLRAIEEFQRAIEFDPGNGKAYFNLGTIYYRQRQFEEAIELFQKALSFEPENVDILFHLGLSSQNQGDLEQAIEFYRKIFDKDEKHLMARVKLSLAYFALNQTDSGVAECRKILAIDPSNETAHINLGLTFFKQGEYEKAIQEYQKAIESNPENSVSFFQMAYCYFWNKNIQKGIECLKEALRINPNYQHARQLLNQVESSLP